jgi:hypothetical protein
MTAIGRIECMTSSWCPIREALFSSDSFAAELNKQEAER